jgi:phage anti-repressor protein
MAITEEQGMQTTNGRDEYVNTAIAASVELMTIVEFIKTTKFDIDMSTFDSLFSNINDGYPVYISEALLDWMGYVGDLSAKLHSCKKKICNNFILDEEYMIFENADYAKYLEDNSNYQLLLNQDQVKLFPKPATGAKARKQTHIIMRPNCFKELCMMLSTQKAKQIRKYYIELEKLSKHISHIKLYLMNAKLNAS